MEFDQVPSPRASAEVPVDLQVLRSGDQAAGPGQHSADLERAVYGDEGSDRSVGLDPHDFAALYISHRASFAGQARRFLRDQRDVDEVVQEAFLRLFLAIPELSTELQAIAYCRRTITNLCIDRYRADQRRPRMLGLDSAPADALLEDEPIDPVVQAEDAAVVRDALARLAPLHREALVKREIEEKPLPVIAAELDVPEESVKHLLFRARRALRRLLAGSTADPAALVRLAAGTSGKLGVLIAIVLAGLGSGPDLRVVPVVGKDLPDLPSVAEVVVKQLPAPVKPRAAAPAPVAPAPKPVVVPVAPQDRVEPALDTPTTPVVPVAPRVTVATTPAPSAAPSPTAVPSASPSAVASPAASPEGAPVAEALPSAGPSAQPSPGTAAERPRPGTAVVGGTPEPSSSAGPAAQPSASPSPQSSASAQPSASAEPKRPTSKPTVFPARLEASPEPGGTATAKSAGEDGATSSSTAP